MSRTPLFSISAFLGLASCAVSPDDPLTTPPTPTAPMPVNCTADYVEQFDRDNGQRTPRPEPTARGIAIGSNFSLCGELNPAFAIGAVLDQDFFDFEVPAGPPLDVRALLRATQPPGLAAQVSLWNNKLELLQKSSLRGSLGIVTADGLQPGHYLLSVEASGVHPGVPLVYQLTVGTDLPPCAANPALTYGETIDGVDQRGNDVLAVDFIPRLRANVSTNEFDMPEPTNLNLAPGDSALISGVSGAISSSGDDYLDRDTYQFSVDLASNEVEIDLLWNQDGRSDLDLLLFAAGDTSLELAQVAGARVSTRSGESLTAAVLPGSALWLFVGRARPTTGPALSDLPYQVSLCARSNIL